MKKLAFVVSTFALLTACSNTQYVEKECPSCNPPIRHFEVVTECTDYQNTSLTGNRYAQCRYCTNKIYSNGVDVTAQFMGQQPKKIQKKTPCRK